ncbi:hypothetical protein FRB90_003427 [Tulasnella sp. 427]|nr:hypothetical protein FRB90_003427 [Tulasnella sp. 427]
MNSLICYQLTQDLRRRVLPDDKKNSYVEYLREAREIKPDTSESILLWTNFRGSGLIDCVTRLFDVTPAATEKALDFYGFTLLVTRVIILSARQASSVDVIEAVDKIYATIPRIVACSYPLVTGQNSRVSSFWATDIQNGVLCTVDCAYVNTGMLSTLDVKTRQLLAETLVRYYLDHVESPDPLTLEDLAMLYRLVPGLAAVDRSLDVYDQVVRKTTALYDAQQATKYLYRVLQTQNEEMSVVMGIPLFLVFLTKGNGMPFRRAVWDADLIAACFDAVWTWVRNHSKDEDWEGNTLRQISLHCATLNTLCGVSRAQRNALTLRLLKESDYIGALAKGFGTLDLQHHSDCLTTLQPVLSQIIETIHLNRDQIDGPFVSRWLLADRNLRVIRRCKFGPLTHDPVKQLWNRFNMQAGLQSLAKATHTEEIISNALPAGEYYCAWIRCPLYGSVALDSDFPRLPLLCSQCGTVSYCSLTCQEA